MLDKMIPSVHRNGGVLLAVLFLSARVPAGEIDSVRALRARAEAAQENLRNYRYCAEFTDCRDYAARKRLLDEAIEAKDVPPGLVAHYRDGLGGSGKEYELQTTAGDAEGRIKIAHTYGKYGPDGGRHTTYEIIRSWDGATCVSYSRHPNMTLFTGAAVLTSAPLADFRVARNPLWSFGGKFFASLDAAIERGENISTQEAGGLVEISFACEDPVTPDGSKRLWSGTIDPSKGFSVLQWGYTLSDGRKDRYSATFAEVEKGVWFPTQGQMDSFFPDGMRDCLTTVTITDTIVNDANFPSSLFHVDLPRGTYVTDHIAGVAFVIGDPAWTHRLGEPTNMDHIVHDALRNSGDPQEQAILVPPIGAASRKGEPFVLDLRMCKLVGIDGVSDSQEALNALHGGGIGDLFWDGDIIAIADTTVQLPRHAEEELLTTTPMQNGRRYKLSDKLQFPCELEVLGRTSRRYRVVVKQVAEEGISIAYKPIVAR